jgi:uncharacterized damage-inducible protein DinB
MKKLFIIAGACALLSFIIADTPLTQKERKYAADLLAETEKNLEQSVAGLSDAQLNFKASDSTWSVDGCVKHLAVSEKILWGALEEALKKPANAEKRADIKVTDEQLVNFQEGRQVKLKTLDVLKPENTTYASTTEALNSIKESRKKIIDFMNTTKDDMRNHVVELPFGSFDAYQVVLLIGSHSKRHTKQIEEVKASTGFPSN